jgi:hypothetical protein
MVTRDELVGPERSSVTIESVSKEELREHLLKEHRLDYTLEELNEVFQLEKGDAISSKAFSRLEASIHRVEDGWAIASRTDPDFSEVGTNVIAKFGWSTRYLAVRKETTGQGISTLVTRNGLAGLRRGQYATRDLSRDVIAYLGNDLYKINSVDTRVLLRRQVTDDSVAR